MTNHDPFRTLVLELVLALGMIVCLISAMVLHTGSMPPLVVVESSSMVHEIEGEVGSIDAGDLILVHDQNPSTIVTFAEATNPEVQRHHGYNQHGLEGDVIIYEKNGENGTPIIHRAILRAEAALTTLPDRDSDQPCSDGAVYDNMLVGEDGLAGSCILTWNVPGTNATNVTSITVMFDGVNNGYYDCKRPAHGNVEPYLVVWDWVPSHEGMLTLGDNNRCSVDQGSEATNGSNGVYGSSGLVGPVRDAWVVGVAGGEIPWLGTVKLMVGGPSSYGTQDVPSSSFVFLGLLIGSVLILPQGVEWVFKRWLSNAPEMKLQSAVSAPEEE